MDKVINNTKWDVRKKELADLKKKRDKMSKEIQRTEELLKELENLKKDREKISKEIHSLSVKINQHENRKGINTDTEVYKMFGKPLKDLTKEEYKIYYNARQRINRQKRKKSQTH